MKDNTVMHLVVGGALLAGILVGGGVAALAYTHSIGTAEEACFEALDEAETVFKLNSNVMEGLARYLDTNDITPLSMSLDNIAEYLDNSDYPQLAEQCRGKESK